MNLIHKIQILVFLVMFVWRLVPGFSFESRATVIVEDQKYSRITVAEKTKTDLVAEQQTVKPDTTKQPDSKTKIVSDTLNCSKSKANPVLIQIISNRKQY